MGASYGGRGKNIPLHTKLLSYRAIAHLLLPRDVNTNLTTVWLIVYEFVFKSSVG